MVEGRPIVVVRHNTRARFIPMTLSAGTRLGPYEIAAPLGAGGMGEVYKARDTRLERTVAMKVLSPAVASNPAFRQRFEREARAISSLDHPHICALYDIGEANGTDFLVMQYLEGETLAQRLTKSPLSLDQALKHAIEIADALDRAHRQGIIHRDLSNSTRSEIVRLGHSDSRMAGALERLVEGCQSPVDASSSRHTPRTSGRTSAMTSSTSRMR